jgi:flagellar protein FlaI
MNELEPLMNDYFIEDIECNGLNTPVYVVHRKYRNIRTNLVYKDLTTMTTFVEKIAQKCGRYVSYAEPLLDGTLPDGSRVNATYTTDVSSRGPTFSIRKFTKEPWSPLQLVQKGTTSLEILAYAWMCIEYEHSFMVVGGTGSGKTSLLNGLAFFIPPQARIVSIEDTRELQLSHENWLPSVSRAGVGISNLIGQKYGEVSLFDLLRASFRQRPDYIIVGEIRGKEAYVLFQAFASGHPGCATMHAENVDTMIRRLETPPINLSGSMLMTLSAVFTIEQTKVRGKDVRKVTSVDEIIEVQERLKGSKTNNVFSWDARAEAFRYNPNSVVFDKIATHYGYKKEDLMKEYQVRVALLRTLYNRGIVGFKEVQDVIHEYYKAPQQVMKRYGLVK